MGESQIARGPATGQARWERCYYRNFRSCHFLCGTRYKHNIVKSVRLDSIKRQRERASAVRSLHAFIKVFMAEASEEGRAENPFCPVSP